MREIVGRVGKAETALSLRRGWLVVIWACDETEDEAIIRAGAEDFDGQLVIIRRFGMTVAKCVAAALKK